MSTRRLLAVFLLLALTTLTAGCGSNKIGEVTPPPGPSTSTVSVAVTDTPPAGVTVISFEVTIVAATLNPGNVPLVSTPIQIEVKRLETEAAFLTAVNVPAGTYTSITFTFAFPELTFKNDTGGPLTLPGLNCLNGAVCEFKPAVSGTATYSGAPFPVTIVANTPTGFLVDVNLNTIITSSMGLNFNDPAALTILQLPLPGRPLGELHEIEDVSGAVANKDAANNQFTLQTTRGNLTVRVDNMTDFEDFEEATPPCLTDNFLCVQNGQSVEVDLRMMASLAAGTLLGKKVELEDNVADDELDGVVVSVDSPTQFKMVLIEEMRNVAGVEVGNVLTVTLATGATFRVDDNGLTIPAGLKGAFENATDTAQLLPGQTVQVRRGSSSSGTTINTDRVRLRGTRFTAKVAGAPAPPNFNIGGTSGLPSLFTAAGITQIQVQTQAATEFEGGITGVTGLADGNTVSLRGLLFKNTPLNPVLIAKKVRKRTP